MRALMRVCVFCLSFVLVACGTRGRPIREWSLDVDGGPSGVTIRLPAHLRQFLPARDVDYTLRATVRLESSERGRPLSVMVDCFHGVLSLRVDGVPAEDVGDSGVGVRTFVIPRSSTDRNELTLVFSVHRDARNNTGFGTVPRLGIDAGGDARAHGVAAFNRYTSIVAILLMIGLFVIYGAVFVFDERRREYVAIIVYGLTLLNVPLSALGIYADLSSTGGLQLSYLIGLLSFAALLQFLHATFRLGRVHRAWHYLLGGFAVVVVLSIGSSWLTMALQPVMALLIIVVNVYTAARMIAMARRDIDARLMLVGTFWHAASFSQGLYWHVSGTNLLGGAHPMSVGIAITALMQGIILGRQYAARRRAVDAANAELQRQVAERSRELGDALARLSQAPSTIERGMVIDGRYQIVRELGAGGMGVVHEVERLEDGRRFALKTLRGRTDPDLMARFAREAEVAAGLDHPNLVAVLDVGVVDGGMFLVMPFVDGGSLEQQRGRFGDGAWARPLLAQIAAGLAALHERMIVHRDLKLANVLLSNGVAQIADFGLAALAPATAAPGLGSDPLADTVTGKLRRDDAASPPLTRTGDVFGTPRYMAPELAGGVHLVKPSSDVYAFGLIAYEVLAGRPPYVVPPLVMAMNGQAIEPPDTSAITTELRDVVSRCLDLDPSARPSAAELVSVSW